MKEGRMRVPVVGLGLGKVVDDNDVGTYMPVPHGRAVFFPPPPWRLVRTLPAHRPLPTIYPCTTTTTTKPQNRTPRQVFLAQKMMINKANIRGKPVITATQVKKKKSRPQRLQSPSVCLSVCPSVCLSVFLSVCLSVY